MVAVDPPPKDISIFSRMTHWAQRYNAVNLAQGFPDFDGPEEVKDAAIAAIRQSKNQYAPAAGIEVLRHKIAQRYADRHLLDFDPIHEVTVVSGATEAIFCSLCAFLTKGDTLISFDPHYESYRDTCLAFGFQYRGIPLIAPTWDIDWTKLEECLVDPTLGSRKVLLINSPHNPTGRVFTRAELEQLAQVAERHDLLVITDEVYEEILYDEREHITLASIDGMKERTVVISSTSKTFSMTGWKIGYVLAAKPFTDRIRFIHQNAVFCSATPLEWGMVPAFDLAEDYFRALRSSYEERRQALCQRLRDLGFQVTLPQGTYFVLAGYQSLSDQSDLAFALRLVQDARVATIPISGFYQDQAAAERQHYIRLAFCKDIQTLDLAYERLKAYLQ